MRRHLFGAAVVFLLSCAAALAQQTAGNIAGRVVDQQGAAVPGATVTAKHPQTGFTRSEVSDASGLYRLNALPVGIYEVTAELPGFATVANRAVEVNVSQTTTIDFSLRVAAVAETVNVTGASPLIETTSSSVGGVVDVKRIESLPLNGRQFANLAMTIPGVGLGFHSDPTKSTQYSPQIAGGNGRNVNYQIDGGDNNDDTVGGLLQLYPLEAVQEFNFITQRYKAEYGRSNGGVMNIVTKSGQNTPQGSFFELFRDTKMNAETETEKLTDVSNAAAGLAVTGKNPYRRNQFGGSFGGPVAKDKAHFFVAVERTQQDTKQPVSTLGLFPNLDGVFPTPNRENLLTAKVSANVTATQYLSVRYGRNTNSQVYGAGTRNVPDYWGDSVNKFNSINLNHNAVLSGAKLNEFIFQYADFANAITARTGAPQETFANGVNIGYNSNTPQVTQQHKFQFRDDFSWHASGMGGLGHDFKTGVNFINEPHLYVTFSSGSTDYAYTHLDNNPNGPISGVSRNKPGASANLPTKQFAAYFQDDWRVTDKLTLNAGVRYDLVDGFAIDQSGVPNFVILTTAAKAGRFNGVPGFDEYGKSVSEDRNNIQPRLGAVYDVHGDGNDVVRGGWGLYYDFGYTNANILFPGLSAQGGSGVIFSVTNTAGIKNPDGSFFRVGQPISNIASQNEVNPNGPFFGSNVMAPQVRQPWTAQTSFGWSHSFDGSTVLDIDYVNVLGHDLGVRWPLNTRINNGARRFADLNLSPASPTMNMSIGESRFNGLNIGIRRRLEKNVQLNAWYSLSKAVGLGGQGIDELTSSLVQDSTHPFADIQYGPAARTDARHKVTVSAVLQLPGDFTVSPIYRFRSALPLHIWYGYDNNLDGVSNDAYTTAYRYTGISDTGVASFEEIGPCETINCGRGASLSQMNLRVSKRVKLGGTMNLEVIGEVFNLFNSINPNFGVGALSSTRFFTGTLANHTPNPVFLRPNGFAGDTGQPEQRVGQIGVRFSF
jgi:outer membrane receptor protein involved in Fe transport